MLDDTDRRLLRQLVSAPEASLSDLAQRAGLSLSAASRRFDRLKADGVIRGIRADIDWRALGYSVEVSLRITLEKSDPNAFDAFLSAARDVPEVSEIQTFLGRVDARLSVLARDMAHYQEVYRDRILTLPHISDIEALMQVAEVKVGKAIPI